MNTLLEERYIFLIMSCSMLLRMRNVSDKCWTENETHLSRFINFSRNRAVWVIMWKIMYSQTGHCAICVLDSRRDSRTRNIKYLFLFHGNSVNASTTQCLFCIRYAWFLCTSAVCSVYRVMSVIMCGNALVRPSSRGNCSAVWDAISLQYI